MRENDKKIKHLSNFSGSNSIALITENKALLWTDSRYYIQAEKELSSDWQMMEMELNKDDLKTYIKKNMQEESVISFDYKNMSIGIYISTN